MLPPMSKFHNATWQCPQVRYYLRRFAESPNIDLRVRSCVLCRFPVFLPLEARLRQRYLWHVRGR